MSRSGMRSWLLPLVASLALTSCASFYRLEVGGDQADQVRSVFLIAADADPLEGGKVDPAGLIRPDKIGSYLLFAQFDPADGSPLRWQEETVDSRSDMITVRCSSDLRTLTLTVDKALLEAYGGLTLVAVGHGAEGWYAESVDAGKIRLENGVRFDVGSARFVRRPLP
jgi:hypothetical protein